MKRQITANNSQNYEQISISPAPVSLGLHFSPIYILVHINCTYLQFPQSKQAIWVSKDSEKYERSHKLHKNKQN